MTLDELLLEWSYRSDKGYPDMDNPSDIQILKEILEQLDLPTDDVLDKVSYANKDGKPGIAGLEPSNYDDVDLNPPTDPTTPEEPEPDPEPTPEVVLDEAK